MVAHLIPFGGSEQRLAYFRTDNRSSQNTETTTLPPTKAASTTPMTTPARVPTTRCQAFTRVSPREAVPLKMTKAVRTAQYQRFDKSKVPASVARAAARAT